MKNKKAKTTAAAPFSREFRWTIGVCILLGCAVLTWSCDVGMWFYKPKAAVEETPRVFPTPKPYTISARVEFAEPYVDRLQPIRLRITYTNYGTQTTAIDFDPVPERAGQLERYYPPGTEPTWVNKPGELNVYSGWQKENVPQPALLDAGQSVQFARSISWEDWYDGFGYYNYGFWWLTTDIPAFGLSLVSSSDRDEMFLVIHMPPPLSEEVAKREMEKAWAERIDQSQYFQPSEAKKRLFDRSP